MSDQKFKNVCDLIGSSDSMEYSWYKRKDDIKQTGIVISFDGAQILTLDFSAKTDDSSGSRSNFASVASSVTFMKFLSSFKKEGEKELMTSVALNSQTSLNPFCGIKLKILGRLLKLSLTSKEEQEKAVKLFESIAEIDIGDYQPMYNNCRSYVTTVAIFLKQYSKTKDDWKAFKAKMKELVLEDQYKFAELKVHISKRFEEKKSPSADQQ